jgi:hypothetical protein
VRHAGVVKNWYRIVGDARKINSKSKETLFILFLTKNMQRRLPKGAINEKIYFRPLKLFG